MKKQTENITSSCTYLLLKALFHFKSQCTSVPYLESSLCKLVKKMDNCNFTFAKLRDRPFNGTYHKVCKYKTFRFTGLFSLHIERPSIIYYKVCTSVDSCKGRKTGLCVNRQIQKQNKYFQMEHIHTGKCIR